MAIRPLADEDDIMPFLIGAFDWRDEGRWTEATVLATPDVAHYVSDWPRPGDGGVVAEEGGELLGSAWWRTFGADDPGYGFVAEDVPEIGLAVSAAARGRGVGANLLGALIDNARALELRGLSLSVEDGNDSARRLYERAGFAVCGRSGNSDTMVLWLA